MEIKSFRELIVWQKAMDFVVLLYENTAAFPTEERFGLTAQLRRAAVSIPSNIAEGHGRQTTRDFLHFLAIAYGSLNESQTQVILAGRLGFLADDRCSMLLDRAGEVARLLNGLTNSLEKRLTGSPIPNL
jgi:four helix bundle protein